MKSRKYLKHGMRNTSTHQSWRALRGRCKNPTGKNIAYVGVSYDPRWEVFLDFLEDMGERPEGTTIDRIDNSKGYFKENCRWATGVEQATNRKTWATTGEKYISKYKYGFRIKITGLVQKRVKTLVEAIAIRNIYLPIKLNGASHGQKN